MWLYSVEPKSRIARWIMKLQEFDFTVSHRPGGANQNANTLSRLNHQSEAIQAPSSTSVLSCILKLLPDISLFDSQHADPSISKISELKEKGFPRHPAFVWRSNNQLYAYWNCWSELFAENGLLMKLSKLHPELHPFKVTARQKPKLQFAQTTVVVPQGLINTVLHNFHNSPSGGH